MTTRPTFRQTAVALRAVGAATGARTASYEFEGRFRVRLAAGWSLVLAPDDAGRFRLDACYRGRLRATMWCLAADIDRLAGLAASAAAEAAALAV